MYFILFLAFKSSMIFIDFTLSGSLFHPNGFVLCFLRENFHEFHPQWFFISSQWIYSVFPSRNFSRILPLVVLYSS
jgi:hypothetical protein